MLSKEMRGWDSVAIEVVEEWANEVAKLERVARAAKEQRDMLRKTRHFSDLTEIEIEIFEALKEAEGLF